MSSPILQRNNVKLTGNGDRTIVFGHGFGCDQNMWRHVAPAFEKDYRVVLFDYVGCGRSDRNAYDPDRYGRIEGYRDDLLEVLEALGLRDITFVGHSISASIGMLAAVEQPLRFSNLIMLGPSPCFVNHPPEYQGGFDRQDIEGLLEIMDKNFLGWANMLAPMVMGRANEPGLSDELEVSICSTDPEVIRRFAQVTFLSDVREYVPKVPVPALILQCSEDIIAPPTVGEYLAARMPKGKLVRMEATGHCPHMSHPQETIDLIRSYLDAPGPHFGQ
ncbi:alpha/beta hydrolase [bacterium]|nr:MAG: alpha/beta hydrolase [bacterium]